MAQGAINVKGVILLNPWSSMIFDPQVSNVFAWGSHAGKLGEE